MYEIIENMSYEDRIELISNEQKLLRALSPRNEMLCELYEELKVRVCKKRLRQHDEMQLIVLYFNKCPSCVNRAIGIPRRTQILHEGRAILPSEARQ